MLAQEWSLWIHILMLFYIITAVSFPIQVLTSVVPIRSLAINPRRGHTAFHTTSCHRLLHSVEPFEWGPLNLNAASPSFRKHSTGVCLHARQLSSHWVPRVAMSRLKCPPFSGHNALFEPNVSNVWHESVTNQHQEENLPKSLAW